MNQENQNNPAAAPQAGQGQQSSPHQGYQAQQQGMPPHWAQPQQGGMVPPWAQHPQQAGGHHCGHYHEQQAGYPHPHAQAPMPYHYAPPPAYWQPQQPYPGHAHPQPSPHHAGYAPNYGGAHPPGNHPHDHELLHGLSSFFNFRDERFVKGAITGAAITFLLTNDSVQKNAIKSLVKFWSMLQGGVEEIKERFQDAEAEIKAEDQARK